MKLWEAVTKTGKTKQHRKSFESIVVLQLRKKHGTTDLWFLNVAETEKFCNKQGRSLLEFLQEDNS